MGLNIAMITTWHQRCGIASYSENLARALAKEDVNVYIVKIPRFGVREATIFQQIVNHIPIDKVDIIHCQHEYGLYSGLDSHFFPALQQLGKPLVTTMHCTGNWEVDAVITNISNKVIVHNEYCRQRVAGEYGDKLVVIPHGMTPLQTPLPPKEVCKKRLGIQQVPIVGYLGFISNYKGLETLVEAVSKVPNIALLIGGGWVVEKETEYIISLKELTLKLLPNRCQWLGFVQDEDLAVTYGAMDIVVYPSRWMTESGAMLMALSHGKAVIASDVAPAREKAEKGALMTFKDANDLSEKIALLLSKPELREKYEEAAKKLTQQNSWSNVAREHIGLYNRVLTHVKA